MQRKLFILPIIAAILILFSAIGFSDHIFSGAGYGITAMNGTTTIANNSNVTTNGVLLNVSANETINMTAGGFAFEWINQSGVGFNITKGIMIVDNNGSTSGNYTTLNVYNLKNGTHSFRVVGWQSNITSENSSGPVIRFTVDSGKPTIVNLTQNNTNYSTASPSIAFNVTDNTATSDINVLAFVDGVPGTTAILALNNTNTTTPLVGLSNGTHTVQLQANDTAGNSRNMSDVVWITVATPTTFNVTITSPLNNTNTTNETTLDILFNLGSYVFANTLNYTVFVDRVPNGTSAFINNNTQTTFTPRDLANGTHVITIEGHDPAGTYKNASVFFTIDQIAPVPKNLTTNNTNFSTASPSFAFNVTDNTAAGAINVTLFIDGVVNGTTQLINNNTNGTISGTAVSNGTHTFVIQAIDPAGNSANTTQGTFTVATPTTLVNVTINLPATNNTNTTNVTQNLIFYSVSNIHANGLNYTVFRNGLSIASAFMSNNTATTVIPGSANGTYTYYVEVVDPSGNYKNSSTITWTIDQIRPVIRNLTANNTNFSTASPSFAFNVTDNTAVGAINVTLFIDGVVNGTTQLINNNTNGTINGRAVADGLHTYIIQAIDPAGNAVNMTQNSTFRVDTVAPTINIQNPANATNGSSTINVNFTSGDSVVAFCTLELDNVNTTNISLGACTNVSLSGLADGSHTIRIWVNDSANNVAVATRGFTVDTTGPSVSLSVSPTAPTAGTYVVVSCSASDLNSNVTTTGLTVTDPLSGVASLSCGGTYTNTNPIGTYTVKYTANDYFGNPSNATVTFTTQNPGGGSSGGGG
ncbi:MAG TPA: hypothetical protein VI968_03560, partial [archaeon]|nr:hypothetical protein [archaeon]